MDVDLERKLNRLKHYSTRYELVATNGDRSILIGYTQRKNRRGLDSMVCDPTRVHAIIALTKSKFMTFQKKAGAVALMGDWTIKFSGRTQRQCYIEGELPYVGSLT